MWGRGYKNPSLFDSPVLWLKQYVFSNGERNHCEEAGMFKSQKSDMLHVICVKGVSVGSTESFCYTGFRNTGHKALFKPAVP